MTSVVPLLEWRVRGQILFLSTSVAFTSGIAAAMRVEHECSLSIRDLG